MQLAKDFAFLRQWIEGSQQLTEDSKRYKYIKLGISRKKHSPPGTCFFWTALGSARVWLVCFRTATGKMSQLNQREEIIRYGINLSQHFIIFLQGGSGRGSRWGRFPRGRGSRGHPARAVCHQPQAVAQPSSWGRGWRRRRHGNAILLLNSESA